VDFLYFNHSAGKARDIARLIKSEIRKPTVNNNTRSRQGPEIELSMMEDDTVSFQLMTDFVQLFLGIEDLTGEWVY